MWSRIFVHVACFFGIYSPLRVKEKRLIPPEIQGCHTSVFSTFDGFLCFLIPSSPPFISKEYLRKLLYFTCFLTCVIMLTGHVSSFWLWSLPLSPNVFECYVCVLQWQFLYAVPCFYRSTSPPAKSDHKPEAKDEHNNRRSSSSPEPENKKKPDTSTKV